MSLARTRSRRTLIAFVLGAVGLVLLPVLGVLSVDALSSSREGRNALSDLPDLVRIPPTPGALLAAVDGDGEVVSMVVLALKPPVDGIARGGTAIVVPVGTRASLDDGTVSRIADTYSTGGVEALQAAVEGALSVTLSTTAVLGEQRLTELLSSVEPVRVTLDAPILDGSTTVVPSGPSSLDAATIAKALAAKSEGSELARLPQLGQLWSAIAARIGSGIGLAPSDGPMASIDDFVRSVFAGEMGAYRLSAELDTDPADNPAGADILRLNLAEATLVTATVLPSVVSPPYASVTFYVRSPLGDSRYTLEAVARLLFAGCNVVLVKEDPSVVIPETNTISFSDPSKGEEAGKLASLLGSYEVSHEDLRIDGVDVVLTLGRSFITDSKLAPDSGGVATTAAPTPAPSTTEAG